VTKKIKIITPHEKEILEKGKLDPNYITGYFFKHPSSEIGFQFDANFTPEGAWQKAATMAKQSTSVVIGGVGTGKTLGVGMGAYALGMVTDHFKFMNVAQLGWQAKIMYDLMLEYAEGTPMEDIIVEKPRRPYPKIVIKYRIGQHLHTASYEFMSIKDDGKDLFSWRGDWVNVEEAGLIDNLGEVVAHLQTRLTGSTVFGRPYMARLSLISNPWDVPYLWYLFDLARSEPDDSLSIVVSTRSNKNVTQAQIKQLLKKIPRDEHERFIDGTRPEGKGSFFSKDSVYKCEDPLIGDVIKARAESGEAGYRWDRAHFGVMYMAIPPRKGRLYNVISDPGSDNAPARNAPVIGVWDMTNFPDEPMSLAAFWWGFGNGEITPYLNKMLELIGKREGEIAYPASFAAMDSTGPQKGLSQLINVVHFDPDAYEGKTLIDGVYGLDFSGSKKMTYLISLKLLLEAGLFRFPKSITGIRGQLTNYDPMLDRGTKPKIPQDIVAMMAMSAYVARAQYGTILEEIINSNIVIPNDVGNENQDYRQKRSSNRTRSKRSARGKKQAVFQ